MKDGVYRTTDSIHVLDDTGSDFQQLALPKGRIVLIANGRGYIFEEIVPARLLELCKDQMEEIS